MTDSGFTRCRNCGRYFPAGESIADAFCSQECTTPYTKCAVCGRYYQKTTKDEVSLCSAECSAEPEMEIETERINIFFGDAS